MSLEVIGAGFGRTGTLSLKGALERLGFARCYHMLEVALHPEHMASWRRASDGDAVDWEELLAGYRAAVDWPACAFWRELRERYPEAKTILSVRDAESWYQSVMSTIYPTSMRMLESEDPARRAFGEWCQAVVWEPCFGGRLYDRPHVMGVFERHNAAVIKSVPADQLLVFESRQGWEPLCAFLGVEAPDEAYPRTNSSEEFQELRGG